MYLNSTGCINEQGQAVSADNEFYAIWAALGFTRAPLYTGGRTGRGLLRQQTAWLAGRQAVWHPASRCGGAGASAQLSLGVQHVCRRPRAHLHLKRQVLTEHFHSHVPLLLCCPACCTGVTWKAQNQAAVLLAAGQKGHRYTFPHAKISTAPPVMNRVFGQAVDAQLQVRRPAHTHMYTHMVQGFGILVGCMCRTHVCKSVYRCAGGTHTHAHQCVGC